MGGWLLMLPFITLALLAIGVVLALVIRHLASAQPRERRGFEMKPITGQPPVLEEKEKNDHG
jgi:hypothetical protein